MKSKSGDLRAMVRKSDSAAFNEKIPQKSLSSNWQRFVGFIAPRISRSNHRQSVNSNFCQSIQSIVSIVCHSSINNSHMFTFLHHVFGCADFNGFFLVFFSLSFVDPIEFTEQM